jgi:hypothetical protein
MMDQANVHNKWNPALVQCGTFDVPSVRWVTPVGTNKTYSKMYRRAPPVNR